MPAANTDKFNKGARRWSGQVGGGGIADASVTTITLASTTGLPTDTAIELTIDRVDANGTLTPNQEEVIRGVVSGSNIISIVRGVEGTAQAHSAGAVVEVRLTASQWNRMIDALLLEHNQDGSHKSTAVSGIIHSVALKDPIVDADEIGLVDSAASWVMKKITFAGLKLAIWAGFQPQDGFTLNIKIVPSAAANALTLAVKGKDGNDLSATNVGYVFLGGAMRTITSALSLTIAQGTTRVFGLGSAAGAPEFTGKEVDYFAQFIWDGSAVRLGMARAALGAKYGLYSSTDTNEKYMALSGGTPAATAPVCVIGRFAAICTFSTPNYNWTVPTFDDDNLVQGFTEKTRLLDWAPVRTVSGGTVPTFTNRDFSKYRVVGKRCFFENSWDNAAGGTAGAGANPFLYTLPFSPANYFSSNRLTVGHGTIFATANSLADCLLNTANQINIWMGGGGVATGASFAAVTRAWWCNGNFEI